MSSFVTRPAMPVPRSCEMSTLCSFAILRTSGDDRCLIRSSVDDGFGAGAAGDGAGVAAAAVGDPSACGDGFGGSAGLAAGAAGVVGAAAAFASPAGSAAEAGAY